MHVSASREFIIIYFVILEIFIIDAVPIERTVWRDFEEIKQDYLRNEFI